MPRRKPQVASHRSPPEPQRRILLVEDGVRSQRARLLGGMGYATDHAANVAEGFVRWHAGHYDLVVIAVKADPASGALLCNLIKREAPRQLVTLLCDGTSLPPTRCPDLIWTEQEGPEYFLARIQALAPFEGVA